MFLLSGIFGGFFGSLFEFFYCQNPLMGGGSAKKYCITCIISSHGAVEVFSGILPYIFYYYLQVAISFVLSRVRCSSYGA